MPMFLGRFEYTVDDKGRLSVPARFREELELEGQAPKFFVTRIHPDYLSAFGQNEFKELFDSIRTATDQGSRETLRRLATEAEPCELDKQGRIMISPSLRKAVGIGRDVMVLGIAKRLEIWDRAKWNAHEEQLNSGGGSLLGGLKVPSDLI